MSHTDDGLLHTWLDGELPPAEEAELREHLATCAACRERADAARATRTRAHEILRYADPVGIDQPDFATIMARRAGAGAGGAAGADAGVGEGRGGGGRPAIRPLLLPWAASVLLAVGAGWFAQELIEGRGADGGRVATIQAEAASSEAADAAGSAAADAAAPAMEPQPAPAAFSTGPDEAAATRSGAAGAGAPPPAAAGRLEPEVPLAATARRPEAEAAEDRATVGEAARQAAEPATQPATQPGIGPVAAMGAERRARTAQEAEPAADRDAAAAQGYEAVRAAAPPPAPPAALQAPPPGWRPATARDAAVALGQAPRLAGGLPVVGYALGTEATGDEGAVRVTQRLPGGELLELVQRPVGTGAAGAGAAAETGVAKTQTAVDTAAIDLEEGGLRIRLRAPIPADSLQRLRERLR